MKRGLAARGSVHGQGGNRARENCQRELREKPTTKEKGNGPTRAHPRRERKTPMRGRRGEEAATKLEKQLYIVAGWMGRLTGSSNRRTKTGPRAHPSKNPTLRPENPNRNANHLP